MKRLYTSLLLFVSLLTSTSFAQNISFQNLVSPEINVCGESERFTVRFTNDTPLPIMNVSIRVDLPTGIDYVGGLLVSNNLGVTFSSQGPGYVLFTCPSVPPFNEVDFSFDLSADFSAIAFQNGSGVFRNTITVTYNGNSSESEVTEAYNILYPALSISSVSEMDQTTSVGGTFSRRVTISNNGFGALAGFVLHDIHNENMTVVSTDVGTLSETEDSIIIAGNAIQNFGDGDNLFEHNETITIVQTIKAVGCSSSQSRLFTTWGCNGTFEESNNRYPFTTVEFFKPNLVVQTNNPFNTCMDGSPDNQSLMITNDGGGPALGVELKVDQRQSRQFSRIDITSIKYSVNGGPEMPLLPHTTKDTYTSGAYDCLGAGAKGGFTATLPEIQPDETIMVSWDRYACRADLCGNMNLIGWKSELTYQDACQSNNYKHNGKGQERQRKDFELFMEYPSDLTDGQEGTFKYLLTEAILNLPTGSNPYLEVVFDIPEGLEFSGNSADLTYTSGTSEWLPSSVTFNNTSRQLTAAYLFPMEWNNLVRSEFTLKLAAQCTSGNSGLKTVGMQLNYVMDSSCSAPNPIPLTCYQTSDTYLQCPVDCSEGLSFQSFTAERISLGSPDNDQDGLADASGSLNMSEVKTNRVMVGDTFQTTFSGVVNTSASVPSWEYGYATSSLPLGDYLTITSASIIVVDVSTGDTLRCDQVAYQSEVVDEIMAASFDYSIATLSNNGCNTFTGFRYEEGDEIYLIPTYRVTSNPGGIVEQIKITNSFYLSQAANPNDASEKFQCDVWAGNMTIIGYSFTSWRNNNVNVQGCRRRVSQRFYLNLGTSDVNTTGVDYFPFEYRNWAVLKHVKVSVPEDYEISDPYVDYYRTQHTNSMVRERQDLPVPQTTNNEFSFDMSSYLVEGGGSLNRADDGFYGIFNINLTPSCNRVSDVFEDLNWEFTFEESELLLGGGDTPVYEGVDRIRYRRADLEISSRQPVQDGFLPTASWDITVTNNSTHTNAINSFLAFSSLSGDMEVLKVEEISSGRTLVQSDGIFRMGRIRRGSGASYRIYSTYDQCERDELVVHTGYDCDGYPSSMASVKCGNSDFSLYVDPQEAGLQTRISSSTKGNPCESLAYVDLIISNSKLGSVQDLFVEIEIPESESIILQRNSLEKLYPSTGTYEALPHPTLQDGYYQMTDVFIDSTIANNGLVGVPDLTMNTLSLRFALKTQAHFEYGDVVEIRIGASKQCGDSIQTIRLNYDPSAVFDRSREIGLDDEDDSRGVAWADYDNDGDPDLFVTTYSENVPNRLYQNNGDGTFTKVTTGNITTDLASSIGATWGDYDNDGDVDLFVTNNIGYHNFLYRNNGDGTFISIQNDEVVSYNGYSHGASWADYDNDGYLDLFVADFFSTRFNLLYHNNGDGTFSQVMDNAIATGAASSVSGIWGDYDDDGLVDLFVANTNNEANFLYKNLGNGQFEEVGAIVLGGAPAKSVGGSWGDYDNDGDIDLFVANAGRQNNNLYENDGDGTFSINNSTILTSTGGNSHGSAWADMDNDGDLDLAVANDQNENNFLFSNNGDGTFSVIDNAVTNDGGKSSGLAWADFDVDGDLDLMVVNHGDEENFFYENKRGNCQNYYCLTLIGSNSNTSAIGTKLELFANAEWQTRYISGQTGGGLGGQNELKQIIGVGEASIIDSLVITWPSGYVQTMGVQKVNNCITLEEPAGAEVFGVVYCDANDNCTYDVGETLIPNTPIYIEPGNIRVLTDEDGRYAANLANGSYILQQGDVKNWDKSCNLPDQEIGVDVFSIGARYGGNDFAVTPGCLLPDVGLDIASAAQRVGFSGYFTVNYKNAGTSTAESVSVRVNFGNFFQPVEASIPWDTVIGTTYIWYVDSLVVGESGSIFIENFLSTDAIIGEETRISGDIQMSGSDCNSTDNEITQLILMQGAIDPNDIAVDPEGPIDADQVLTYKIRFQNVGNFPVKHVCVEDQLPAELDVNTLEMGSVSHPYRLRVEGQKLIWSFDNINLPDSIRDEVNSHGFIYFRIKPITGLKHGDAFENSANIFFDSQDPIQTNIVENEIFEYQGEAIPGQLAVYPNPIRDFSIIEIISESLNNQRVMIREILISDMVGRPVHEQRNLDQERIQIFTDQLSRGYYFIRVRGEDGRTYTGKVLKH